MINELKELVDSLQEDEAKTLLFQLLIGINRLGDEKTPQNQVTKDLQRTLKDIMNYTANKSKSENDYETIHIVFDDAISGGLKMALSDMELRGNEKVICLSDTFSIGPIWKLHEDIGLTERYKWLENHLLFDGEDMKKEKIRLKDALLAIGSIPKLIPIIVWTGDNSHEQTGTRLALYLLKEKPNDIYMINTSTEYRALVSESDSEYIPLYSGGLSHDKLKLIYEKKVILETISPEERKRFEKEWDVLTAKRGVLRLWQDEEISNVSEDFYDDYIIDTVRRLHSEDENRGFMKSARVIGEVIGHLNQYIGDRYLEYRVRTLVMSGVFEIEGVPKGMRFYSVKLR